MRQLIDTELQVARKYLHFSQRELYVERFTTVYYCTLSGDPNTKKQILRKIKYWRARYNAACAIEQSREAS